MATYRCVAHTYDTACPASATACRLLLNLPALLHCTELLRAGSTGLMHFAAGGEAVRCTNERHAVRTGLPVS